MCCHGPSRGSSTNGDRYENIKKKPSFGLRHKFAVFVFGGLSFTEHVLKYVLNSVEFYMIVCHCCLCTSNSTL